MTISRRQFLRRSALGSAAAAAGGAALTTASGCGNNVNPAPLIDSTVTDLGLIKLELSRYPDLQPVGGALTVRLMPNAAAQANGAFTIPPAILLVHHALDQDPAKAFSAMDSACTHAGCPLGYNPTDKKVECPCHASTFRVIADPNVTSSCIGDVLHKPAVAGPQTYGASFDGTFVTVDLSQTSPGCYKLPPASGGKIVIPVAGTALATVGGSIVGGAMGFGKPLAVVRVDQNTVIAVSATCTHLGCPVMFDKPSQELVCPCHSSIFALDGTVRQGPATRNLDKFVVDFDGTTATITVM